MINPVMGEFLTQLLVMDNEMWHEELIFELFLEFNVLVSQPTMSRFTTKLKLSKKVGTRRAAQQDWTARCLFDNELASIPAEDLVYLDESYGSERTLLRKRAWSLIGLPAYTEATLRHAQRFSILPALTVDGYLPGSTLVVRGSVTGAIFEHWLEYMILPQLKRGKVLVMDNCSTHHGERLKDLCAEAGVRLLYLPPYSPDYNPIEQTFHVLKQWLKRHNKLAPSMDEEDYNDKFLEFLKEAVEMCLIGVDVRAMFRKARVRC